MFIVSGTPTIYLVDPSKRSEAVAALYAAGVGRPSYDVRQAQVLHARWDFGQLYDWYNYINSVALARVQGWASTDIDEKQNRLVYGMVDDNSKSQMQALFQSLGVPCELAVVNVTGPFISSAPPTREVQFATAGLQADPADVADHTRVVGRDLLTWYDEEHHHAALGYLTPADAHFGRAAERRAPV